MRGNWFPALHAQLRSTKISDKSGAFELSSWCRKFVFSEESLETTLPVPDWTTGCHNCHQSSSHKKISQNLYIILVFFLQNWHPSITTSHRIKPHDIIHIITHCITDIIRHHHPYNHPNKYTSIHHHRLIEQFLRFLACFLVKAFLV